MREGDLAAKLECTVNDLRNAKIGVFGILIDHSTGDYWIK